MVVMAESAGGRGPVLVAGATGQSGRLIVAELVAAGYPVRALVRDRSRGAALGAGVELVTGDVREPASLGAAMVNASAVISAIGGRAPLGRNGFRAIDWEGNRALIDAARSAGVSRVLVITAGSAGRGGFPYSLPVAPYPWKARAEAYLRASGLAYTILAPGGLTDEPPGKGVRAAPRSTYQTGRISRADLARVTVACLAEPATTGRTITLVNDAGQPADGWRSALKTLPPD